MGTNKKISNLERIETGEYLPMAEFAREIGVSRQAVLNSVNRGVVRKFVLCGKTKLIHLSESDKFPRRKK